MFSVLPGVIANSGIIITIPVPALTFANSTTVYANRTGFSDSIASVQQMLASLGYPVNINYGTASNTDTGDNIYVSLVKLENGIAAAEVVATNRAFFSDPFFADGMFARI